jgi:hypothetical protein
MSSTTSAGADATAGTHDASRPCPSSVELQTRQDQLAVLPGERRAVEGMHGHGVEAVELIGADGPDRVRIIAAAGRIRHVAFVPGPALRLV